jgi:DNA-binding Lrp family transcriptional regulator
VIDVQILRLLRENGRMSNSAIATATSTAESTSHARVQALRESGVITGIHADVDVAAMGRPLQALIFVRIHPGARLKLEAQSERISQLPAVLDVFFLGGHYDFVVHVAVPDPAALRAFVIDELSSHKEISGTETSVILERRRGRGFAPLG